MIFGADLSSVLISVSNLRYLTTIALLELASPTPDGTIARILRHGWSPPLRHLALSGNSDTQIGATDVEAMANCMPMLESCGVTSVNESSEGPMIETRMLGLLTSLTELEITAAVCAQPEELRKLTRLRKLYI